MIDNEFYHDLGEKWFTSQGDAVALLRQENQAKLPWVIEQITRLETGGTCRILDVGCGGGFLTLELARLGHELTGLDVSERILTVGRARDADRRIQWVVGQAEALPFPDGNFDVVCIMDVLEHLEDKRKAVVAAARVVRPGGLLLLHTFNRTWLSWLFAAKGLDWFIKDSQPRIHDWNLFIRPDELEHELERVGFHIGEVRGIRPDVMSLAFLKLLCTGRVSPRLRFVLSAGHQIGYLVSAEASL